MAFSARRAEPEDYAAFVRLHPELGVHDPLPDEGEFAHMRPRVLVLDDGGATVAYAFWQMYGRTAHVVQVVVAPAERGRGAGRALLEALRARVRDEGCARWYLNVKRDNLPAIRLYRRCGFTHARDAFAIKLAWAQVAALPLCSSTVEAITPGDDQAIGACFAVEPERIALLRARGALLVALTEAGAPVAFAAFEPAFPRAYPLRVARVELARPLLEALRPHAGARAFVILLVEGDRALKDALAAAGAEVVFELMQMSAELPSPAPRDSRENPL